MCGESMRLDVRQRPEHRPVDGRSTVRTIREWVCPGCDYFEEADAGEG